MVLKLLKPEQGSPFQSLGLNVDFGGTHVRF